MIQIKALSQQDYDSWKVLWQGYLDFYKVDLPQNVTETTWQRLLDPHKDDQIALGAYLDEKLVGFATLLYHDGTWSVEPYCYLEDLFVSEECRGKGAARKLMNAVYEHAKQRGASQVYWSTQEGNKVARKLYDQMATITDFVKYKKTI